MLCTHDIICLYVHTCYGAAYDVSDEQVADAIDEMETKLKVSIVVWSCRLAYPKTRTLQQGLRSLVGVQV